MSTDADHSEAGLIQLHGSAILMLVNYDLLICLCSCAAKQQSRQSPCWTSNEATY